MLKSVHIKNLALIEEAEIDYTKGLNIMTGETGSGKSVIIGAVNTALGEKANKSMIRTGALSALVELLFTDCDERALEIADSLGVESEGGDLLISRKLRADSSAARINGEYVTLANLKKVTAHLVDVHGQHDHQSLLDPAKHMEIIDEFGKEKIKKIKDSLSEELAGYKRLRASFREYDKDEGALAREISLLEYEVDEIENAGLIINEDKTLSESYVSMARLRDTWDILAKIRNTFADENRGLLQECSLSLKDMEDAVKINPDLMPFKNTLMDIDSLVKDFSHDISRYMDDNPFDREKFTQISERLNLINMLKSKYGNTIEDIISCGEDAAARLKLYRDFDENKKELEEKLARSKIRINVLAKELSAARKECACVLEKLVSENLKDLNFLNSEFHIEFERAQKISAEGFDKISFMISLNPGEPLKPLSSVASGGELSRIMLALKCSIAENDRIETLIFDEIDTGISGNTAFKVSEKLKKLSKSHQVICITHLPQIASKADSHFLIEKEVTDGSTISGVRLLDEEASVNELAKMISGSEITAAALLHARELKADG